MKLIPFIALSAVAAAPVLAQETRELGSHEHGVGQLDIAFEGDTIAMELHAPGADIVGFEYEAESDEDLAAIDKALATLAQPLELFMLPGAAGCSVVEASAELESEEEHDDHDDHDEEHADEKHDEDHEDHDDHDHDEEHADDHGDEHDEEHAHDDHSDEKHDEHDHDEHDHDEHAEEAGHTEFHAEYMLTCTDPSAVTEITFAYFETFPNALEVEVQVVSDAGATAFEVERDAPTLDLSDLF